MRQQFTDSTCLLHVNALDDVLELDIRIVPVDPGRLHHAQIVAARKPARGETATIFQVQSGGSSSQSSCCR